MKQPANAHSSRVSANPGTTEGWAQGRAPHTCCGGWGSSPSPRPLPFAERPLPSEPSPSSTHGPTNSGCQVGRPLVSSANGLQHPSPLNASFPPHASY